MSKEELDARIRVLGELVLKLCEDLGREELSIENAVALGSLLAAFTILRQLGTPAPAEKAAS